MKSQIKPPANPSSAQSNTGFEANILQLVKGARARRAIESGEIDAVLDPASGHVILLPEAQTALLQRKARFKSLMELATDGYWEQDDQYRFSVHSGAHIGNETCDARGAESILGKTLWDLPFDNNNEIDWPTYRTQLEWRAIFRDLHFRCVDRDGGLRILAISGEPMFNADGQFTGYRGITRDITGQAQIPIETPESDRFARATLDALAAQVCVLDSTGTIVTANVAWRVLAATHRGEGAQVDEGSNYLAACDRVVGAEHADAATMVAGIRQVIAGERELFRYEYFCAALSGPRWFMATITRMRGHGTARAVVSYEDVTEIKRAEQLLRLECTVARCLADTAIASVALQNVIRAICEVQQWECGRYFCPGEDDLLSLSEFWGKPNAAVQQFIEKSRHVKFRPGAGFAGRVFQSSEPRWTVSGAKEVPAASTLAHESGTALLPGAFAFPVVAADATLGVLAFAGAIVREPDDRLLKTVRNIGGLLGQFLQRRVIDESLRASEMRFRRLTELSSDWYWEQDRHYRFTKIVGTSMSAANDMLGKTLWELPNIVVSDSEWLKHKSELTAQWSFCDFECALALADGRLNFYRISGEPLFDEQNAFIGFHGTGLDITRCKQGEVALCDAGQR